jgi:hypothetical protein
LKANFLVINPPHQVRHICKAHKADTHTPTLQKSLPCANAQATLYGWTQTHIIDDHGERANVQQEYCQKRGVSLNHQQNNVIELLFQVDFVLSSIAKKIKFKVLKVIRAGLMNKNVPPSAIRQRWLKLYK